MGEEAFQVEILMPVRHGAKISGKVLNRYLLQQMPPFRFLFDNQGPNVEESDDRHTLIRLVATKRATLITKSQAPILFFTDDNIVLPEWPLLGCFLELFQLESVGVVGSMYLPDHPGAGAMMTGGDLARSIAVMNPEPCECWGYINAVLNAGKLVLGSFGSDCEHPSTDELMGAHDGQTPLISVASRVLHDDQVSGFAGEYGNDYLVAFP